MSEEFGNPALFEADSRTELRPAASTIAATGTALGSRVFVAFEGHGTKTQSGAYLLTRFVVIP